jgi:predicted deacylase
MESSRGGAGDGCAVRIEQHPLPEIAGLEVGPLTFQRFGQPGARPKAYVQTALHADELPGMLVLRQLAAALTRLQEENSLRGEVVLAPVANPIGLAQTEGGYLVGRVERATGRNFNRGYPDLCELIRADIAVALGDDPAANTARIRAAMRAAAEALPAHDAFTFLQRALIHEACDADIVLDVHADNEALLHLYVAEENWPGAQDLAAELDARAVLLTDESGGAPFDEACGHAWVRLRQAFPQAAIPLACLSATVELRSNNHVTYEDADRDARALLRFLMRRGVIEGAAGALPRLLCRAAPIRAMQQLRSPAEGLIVYHRRLGDTVRPGDVIADIVPRQGGDPVSVAAVTRGLLFARHDQRWAWPGKVIGKVAGEEVLPERTGDLLTD